jgi:hypothetical protein
MLNRNRNWKQFAKRKYELQIAEVQGSFTEAERKGNIQGFLSLPENAKLWERLEETEKRLPWCRSLVASLRGYVEFKGKMTDKQKSLATSLYLDCCMTTDDKLEEQVNCRKLGYRLLELQLGRTGDFVRDVMCRCDGRAFTGGQMRAFYNIAKRVAHPLANIPEINDEIFDGWFKKNPSQKIRLDNECGL